ncbi:2-dehydropantoate 2-reductase [Afipia massiliensis]|uniref:2-dehydropantoate 2-reductase n=1 Tax=Afipia massiliensis TaxID=211460 RepID=A0A4U6BL94_9BRAD|nr:2-dehydropantoate 2-reductase [Afipia massiliensis]TKT70957.1 2-dehydropantoate 2-reductase [Afipia massiliensis]
MTSSKSICVAGAGSIGCFVGGMLRSGGHAVSLLARPRVIDEINRNGLKVTSFEGIEHRLSSAEIKLSGDPAIFADADIILVTVKSDDTAEIAELIAQRARKDAVIVSLQNGTGNVSVLREAMPDHDVLAGMVPFNVLSMGEGHFHRATSGDILLEKDDAETAKLLSTPELVFRGVDDIEGVQWGKLLVNLNNALNALSGLPLRDQLAQRSWRVLFADQMREALAVIKAEGIAPVSTTPLPASFTPFILKLPDALFTKIAASMVKIDPKARSSMWEDLQRGRRTEIDHLQGLIVALAQRHGLKAPLSARIVALIREAEQAAKGSPGLTPEQVRSPVRPG